MHTGFSDRAMRNMYQRLRTQWYRVYECRCPLPSELRGFNWGKHSFHKPMTAPEITGKVSGYSVANMRTRVFYTKRKPEKYRYSRNDENSPCYRVSGKIVVLDV